MIHVFRFISASLPNFGFMAPDDMHPDVAKKLVDAVVKQKADEEKRNCEAGGPGLCDDGLSRMDAILKTLKQMGFVVEGEAFKMTINSDYDSDELLFDDEARATLDAWAASKRVAQVLADRQKISTRSTP